MAITPWWTSAPAKAEVMTILAVINTCIALSKLFSGGPGIADLIALQSEMLKKLSEQLGTIQSGITTIVEGIDELKKQIDNVPDRTVLQLYNARAKGLLVAYNEHLRAYNSARETDGILAAEQKFVPLFEKEILVPVRDVRSVLIGLESFSVIPMVCLASYIEFHCMILANYHEQPARMREAHKTYSDWLIAVTQGPGAGETLQSAIQKARRDRAEAIAASMELKVQCKSVDTLAWTPACPSLTPPPVPGPRRNIAYHKERFVFKVTGKTEGELFIKAKEMVAEGILKPDEVPIGCSIEHVTQSGDESYCELVSLGTTPLSNTVMVRDNSEARDATRWITELPVCGGNPVPEAQKRAEHFEKLIPEVNVRLMSLRALEHASRDGRAFLDRMRAAM